MTYSLSLKYKRSNTVFYFVVTILFEIKQRKSYGSKLYMVEIKKSILAYLN